MNYKIMPHYSMLFYNDMKIIRYDSSLEVQVMAEHLKRNQDVFDTVISTSFRVFDEYGNTIEFHVYYKPKKK